MQWHPIETAPDYGVLVYVAPLVLLAVRSKSGKLSNDHKVPRLFWDAVPPIVAPQKPMQAPPVDTLVRVRNTNGPIWLYKYSAGKLDSDWCLLCFVSGATSKTVDKDNDKPHMYPWRTWEIVDGE